MVESTGLGQGGSLWSSQCGFKPGSPHKQQPGSQRQEDLKVKTSLDHCGTDTTGRKVLFKVMLSHMPQKPEQVAEANTSPCGEREVWCKMGQGQAGEVPKHLPQ